MGPHKDRGKLWPGWDLNPRPSGLITAAPPTELQGQTGAGRGKWRCKWHGNEYVDKRKGYVALATYGRVALISATQFIYFSRLYCIDVKSLAEWRKVIMAPALHEIKKKPTVMDSLITASRNFRTSTEVIWRDRLLTTSKTWTKVRAARTTRLFPHLLNPLLTAPVPLI